MTYVLVEITCIGHNVECKAVTGPFTTPRAAAIQVIGEDSPLLVRVEADGYRMFQFNDTLYFIEEIYFPEIEDRKVPLHQPVDDEIPF